MPNGDSQLSGTELQALLRRSALLLPTSHPWKTKDSVDKRRYRFSSLTSKQGCPSSVLPHAAPQESASALQHRPQTPSDLSTLIGNWNITPPPLREECRLDGVLPTGFHTSKRQPWRFRQ